MNSKQLAIFAKVACDEKKGVDPLILDIRKLTDIAEYFVLVHGTSDRHVRTIADHILEHLHAKKVRPLHVEGRNESLWVLLDYGSVMVHVFHHEKRKFYSLERLWGDASIVKAAAKNERPVKSTRRFRTA